MRRSVRGHPIVSGIFCVINESAGKGHLEKAYAVIKNVFKSGHTMVTTLARVAV